MKYNVCLSNFVSHSAIANDSSPSNRLLRLHIFSAEKAMIQTSDCYKYKRWSMKRVARMENEEISSKDGSNEYFSS